MLSFITCDITIQYSERERDDVDDHVIVKVNENGRTRF